MLPTQLKERMSKQSRQIHALLLHLVLVQICLCKNNAVVHFWICSYTYVFVLGIGVHSSVNPWFLLPFSGSISVSFYGNRGIWALQVDQDQQRSSSSLSLWGERGRPVYEPRNLLETTWHKNEVISSLHANQGSSEQMILAVYLTVKPRLTVPHV